MVKVAMGTPFLAYKSDSFVMKLFHFVCEKRHIDWLLLVLQYLHTFIVIKIKFRYISATFAEIDSGTAIVLTPLLSEKFR
jgi:hypothetical protein